MNLSDDRNERFFAVPCAAQCGVVFKVPWLRDKIRVAQACMAKPWVVDDRGCYVCVDCATRAGWWPRTTGETSDEWHDRMMKETEGMGQVAEILAHLYLDGQINGLPPKRPTETDPSEYN